MNTELYVSNGNKKKKKGQKNHTITLFCWNICSALITAFPAQTVVRINAWGPSLEYLQKKYLLLLHSLFVIFIFLFNG